MHRETIRVGLIGAGRNMKNRHIPGLQAIAGVEIVGVANRSRASSEAVVREFGLGQAYDSWEALLADPQIDAVVIGTWPYMHATLTLAALAAGKHVLCEARMARNVAEARAMVEAALAKPTLVAQLVPSPFTLRVDAKVQQLLADGYLGDVLAVEVRDGGEFIDPDASFHWRHSFEYSGYNIMHLGIWYESCLRWLGGVTHVTAMGQTFVKMRRDAAGLLQAVRIPDHLDVIARMACGAQMHLQISSVTGLASGLGIHLFGSAGTLYVTPEQQLYGGRRGDNRLAEIDIPPELQGEWRVEAEFIGAIRGEEPVRYTTFADGLQYMEFTEAVSRSLLTGQTVALPL